MFCWINYVRNSLAHKQSCNTPFFCKLLCVFHVNKRQGFNSPVDSDCWRAHTPSPCKSQLSLGTVKCWESAWFRDESQQVLSCYVINVIVCLIKELIANCCLYMGRFAKLFVFHNWWSLCNNRIIRQTDSVSVVLFMLSMGSVLLAAYPMWEVVCLHYRRVLYTWPVPATAADHYAVNNRKLVTAEFTAMTRWSWNNLPVICWLNWSSFLNSNIN